MTPESRSSGTSFKVVATILIGVLALIALSEYRWGSSEAGTIASLNNQVASDQQTQANLQVMVSNLQGQLDSSQTTVQQLQAMNNQLTNEATQLSNENAMLSHQAEYPTLVMWNTPTTIGSGGWRAAGVPDTFDYNVSFSSDTDIIVFFLNFAQFVQFATCGQSCVTGSYICFPNCTTVTTGISGQVFTLAEGCAAYISVFYQPSWVQGSGTIRPDVTITRNPASSLTGYCAT